MSNRKLSKYVTEQMFCESQTAVRFHLKNEFNNDTFKNAVKLSQEVTDCIVDHYVNHVSSKCYLIMSSGLRVKLVNEKVGGSEKSQHQYGNAEDITIYGITQKQLFNDLLTGVIKQKNGRPLKEILDQVIYEGTWIHVQRTDKPRRMFLKAVFTPGKDTEYIAVTKPLL